MIILENDDPAELEDGPTNYSTDNDDEEEVPNKTKRHTIRPCDVIMKKTREQLDIWLVKDPLSLSGILYLMIFWTFLKRHYIRIKRKHVSYLTVGVCACNIHITNITLKRIKTNT